MSEAVWIRCIFCRRIIW